MRSVTVSVATAMICVATLGSIALLSTTFLAGSILAADEKVAFPANYGQWVLYATYNDLGNRPETLATGPFRELYATQATLDAARAGKPLPYGTVLVRVRYDVQRDAKGNPVQDANGRLTKTRLLGFGVMEKRVGWGREHPEGEWEYRGFTADQKANLGGMKPAACYACHQAAKGRDYVFSYDQMAEAGK